MASLKSYFASKSSVAVVKTTSSSSEGASISTVDLTRNEIPATTLQDQAPSISASECSLQCCILNCPTPTRLDVDKESLARSYGKRKRYFQPDVMLCYVMYGGRPLERWTFKSCDLGCAPVPHPTMPWHLVGILTDFQTHS